MQHKLVRDYKRGNLVSYFLNNATKTYRLNFTENIEIEHVFQSKVFLHLSSNLRTSCLSTFKSSLELKSMLTGSRRTLQIVSGFCPSLVSVLELQSVTTIHRMCQVSKTCCNTLIRILTNCLYGMNPERYIFFIMMSTLPLLFNDIFQMKVALLSS